MDDFYHWFDAWMLALAFAGLMFTTWTFGWRLGRRLNPEPGEDPGSKYTDVSMALLGLLLAFTFSMSLGRHDQRRLAIVAESNAIGDFYTSVSMLKEPKRSELQAVIRNYAQHQIAGLNQLQSAAGEEEALRRSLEMQAQMSALISQSMTGPTLDVTLMSTLNNLTSTYASRLAAYDEILPWSIVALLLLSSIIPTLLMGLKQGEMHRLRLSGTLSFIVLVSLVIFVTLDLNQPRRGLIRVHQESFERLLKSFGPK